MPEVVLLYRQSCPNVRHTRLNLIRALSMAALPAAWREVDLEAADTPASWRVFGSPTILVSGVDVDGAVQGEGASCRLYTGLSRGPSVESIVEALVSVSR